MRFHLEMPEDTIRALSAIARQTDVTVGQLIRDAVALDLRRRRAPKRDARTDEALVASLRSLLAQDLADATGWPDLDQRLMQHGFALRPAGGGLILTRLSTGARLCKASDLGYAHSTLARRFGAAFPGHPHAHLFAAPDDDAVLED
ncbi:hypothetical protein AB3Y40_18490 [Yoonia sp. R2331]|uniref:hypothetical protein n=1 Tax=Yoonia sp. R2331 TaxID=3237238 RepID=UPI0034E42761